MTELPHSTEYLINNPSKIPQIPINPIPIKTIPTKQLSEEDELYLQNSVQIFSESDQSRSTEKGLLRTDRRDGWVGEKYPSSPDLGDSLANFWMWLVSRFVY